LCPSISSIRKRYKLIGHNTGFGRFAVPTKTSSGGAGQYF
jgi:hypothetical protein